MIKYEENGASHHGNKIDKPKPSREGKPYIWLTAFADVVGPVHGPASLVEP
jgi:hypothetical protein